MYNTDIYMKHILPINEQSAVISDDMNDRLRDYLDNEDFLEKLSVIFRELDNGETTTLTELQISGKEYGILDNDIIHIKVDKSDIKNPKFYVWAMNDEFVFGDVDLDLAAQILHQAGVGSGGFGNIGNAIGSLVGLGDPGDDGTSEEALVGVAGALAMAAKEKNIDPKVYFDKLAKIYLDKFGESITSFLETEFSGRAETAALNTFRQGIPSSVSRGVNLPAILGDVALTIASFGIGTAAAASARGLSAATKIKSGATVAHAASKTGKLASSTSKLKRAWSGLKPATKINKFTTKYPAGSNIKYITQKGDNVVATIVSNDGTNIVLKAGKTTYPAINIENLVAKSGGPGGMALSSLAALVPKTSAKNAGLILTAKKSGDIGDSAAMSDPNLAEIMGYYDSLTADPSNYISDVKSSEPAKLAQMILDLKNGSGFWGNTTNQEELAMTLIITSITPESAMLVKSEYERLDVGNTIYAVLDDELGGDMGLFAKAWWAGCTGEGLNNHPEIKETRAQLKKVRK